MKKRMKFYSPKALGILVGILLVSWSVSAGEGFALSKPTTSTSVLVGRSANTTSTAKGRAFANELLNKAALPAGAVATNSLPAPLSNAAGIVGLGDVVDVHRNYVLARPLNLAAFVKAHHPLGATIGGPESMAGNYLTAVTGYQLALPLANRHLSYEQLDYSVGVTSKNVEELRVDAEVVWVAIESVTMPTSNPVVVTGFGQDTSMRGSSDPTSVTLTKSQAVKLRGVISSLSNTGGGICMEDSTLFTITTSTKARSTATSVKWTASADVCPGVLSVVSGNRHVSLDDKSCVLRSLVGDLLPPGKAAGTRRYLKDCLK